MQEVSHTWYKQYKDDISTYVEPIEWDEFVIAFSDRLFTPELREAKMKEFINIK